MSLTSIRDTDLLVLDELSGKDLVKMCIINRHFHNLCSKDFWARRIKKDFPQVFDNKKSLEDIENETGKKNSGLYQALYKRFECMHCGNINTKHIEKHTRISVSCKNCNRNYDKSFKCWGCQGTNTTTEQKPPRTADEAPYNFTRCKDCDDISIHHI